jgi:hypothetical protein
MYSLATFHIERVFKVLQASLLFEVHLLSQFRGDGTYKLYVVVYVRIRTNQGRTLHKVTFPKATRSMLRMARNSMAAC